jgi:hypothetical protein
MQYVTFHKSFAVGSDLRKYYNTIMFNVTHVGAVPYWLRSVLCQLFCLVFMFSPSQIWLLNIHACLLKNY